MNKQALRREYHSLEVVVDNILRDAKVGSAVRGTYFGQSFEGVVYKITRYAIFVESGETRYEERIEERIWSISFDIHRLDDLKALKVL